MDKLTALAQICATVKAITEQDTPIYQVAAQLTTVIETARRGELNETQLVQELNRIAIEAKKNMYANLSGNLEQSWYFAFFIANLSK